MLTLILIAMLASALSITSIWFWVIFTLSAIIRIFSTILEAILLNSNVKIKIDNLDDDE